MKELRFLLLLTDGTKHWSKAELAKKMGTSVRTIERYIAKLKEVGFIFTETRGKVSLKQASNIYDDLTQLVYFNEEDAVALYNALDAIETNSEIKANLKEKLRVLYSSETIKEKIIRLNSSHKTQDLLTAIEQKRQVILHNYSSPSSQSKADRFVEPFQMTDGNKQVWCWEIETGKNKIFNLNRIESVELKEECWKHSMHHQAGFTDAFHMISFNGKTMNVRFRMNQMAYSLLIDEYPLTEEDITQTGEKEWLYDGQVSSYKGVGRFVLGLADCIKVESEELDSYLKNFANLYII